MSILFQEISLCFPYHLSRCLTTGRAIEASSDHPVLRERTRNRYTGQEIATKTTA